jgi:hypothetical protein
MRSRNENKKTTVKIAVFRGSLKRKMWVVDSPTYDKSGKIDTNALPVWTQSITSFDWVLQEDQ